MKRILIAPDKFKGSLTSFEVCKAIAAGIRAAGKDTSTLEFPMADGGDGFAPVMRHYCNTETIECPTEDPLGRPLVARYELDKKNGAAIIEMASASGLALLKDEERNAGKTSTLGTGLLIRDAISRGMDKIILGLGGSATNDAGAGILEALGWIFADEKGDVIHPTGGILSAIDRIITPAQKDSGHRPSFQLACDVQNVLYGPQGAAYIYGPQKGAGPDGIPMLDQGLRHFADLIHRITGRRVADIPGTGAAGGIAAGLMAFFDVEITSGVDLVLQAAAIDDILPEMDMIITGEGKIDAQTEQGKVVSRLVQMAATHGIPAIAFCGIADPGIIKEGIPGLQDILTIKPDGMDTRQSMAMAAALLEEKAKDYFTRFY